MIKYLLYHAQCPDGFGAAWSFYKKYGEQMKYIPCFYGQSPPQMETGAEVFIADFSFPRETLLEIKKNHPLVLLDHHVSAQKVLEGLDFAHFDINRSGARIAWEYLFGTKDTPLLILYLEDRDLWRFKLPHSKEVHEVINSTEYKFAAWNNLSSELENNFDEVVKYGKFSLGQTQVQVSRMCEKAGIIEVDGHRVPCINTNIWQSEIGHHLLNMFPECKFSVTWFVDNLNEVQVSFRSRGDFDVSELARKFGGGGHKPAAGCSFKSIPRFIK